MNNTRETLLYAVRSGNEDWQEELITCTTDPQRVEDARKWAEANGFDRFRVAYFDGSAPEFSQTIA